MTTRSRSVPANSSVARPGYPLFLAAIGGGREPADATPLRVKAAQAVVGAVGVWLIGLLALRAGGGRAGVTAAAIAAVYPPLLSMPSYVLSETLYSTVALASALILQNALSSRPGSRPAIVQASLAGLLVGIGALIRPAMLFFLPVAAVWLCATRRARLALLIVAMALVPIVPWTIRNVRVYERFVLIASEGGVTFWTGNHPLAVGEGDLAANLPIKQAELEFRRAHPGLTPEAMEPLYYRDALSYIATHPIWWMSLRGPQGLLSRGAPGAVLCATLDEVSRRVDRAVSAPAAIRNRRSAGPCARAAAACGPVLAGRLRRADVPHFFSAGAIQDSRD